MLEMGVRFVLAGALIWAAVAKLARPSQSRGALGGFGFPSAFRGPAWIALVGLELLLAGGALAGSIQLAWLGAAFMLALASALSGAIARGRAGEDCGCFGAHSKIGWSGVLRNLALSGGFVFVAVTDEATLSTDQWLGLGLIGALGACAGLGVAVYALARELGLLRLRVGPTSALEIPSEGPELGSRTSLVERLAGDGELGLAVFSSVGCHICEALSPAVDSLAQHPAVALARFDEHEDADVWVALDIPGSPYAVAVDRQDGTVLAKGTFNNLAQLEGILGAGERRRAESVTAGA